ncbi:nestin [Polymixia lowei]
MDLRAVRLPFHHSHLGEERHQMLNLNRRLETYLGRVKHLEEENELLREEIQGLRRSDQGASSRRKGLENELRQVRVEVEAAWRERDRAELEVGSLAEELQALDLQRQREAKARAEAKTMLEASRKEMEEEQRAQIWLREKVNQLEEEIHHVVQTHQEDVVHLEVTLSQYRRTIPPVLAATGTQTPGLLQLGQEYSQRATRVWKEAVEAYQGQVAQLEESLNQARSHLAQVGQEKNESQLKVQVLKKELASAQDLKDYLEKRISQQSDRHSQEMYQLQEHVQGLEVKKEDLGQQIDALLLDSRCLLQLKMSLGLEVATYRALLDNERPGGDISSVNQPRNIYMTDAVSSPRGVKEYYKTQLSTSHMTAPLSSIYGVKGRSKPAVITATSVLTQKPVTLNQTQTISLKPAQAPGAEAAETTKSPTWSPYPKVQQSGTVEHFRPQEVHEEVNYAEPLSPPNEEEPVVESLVAEGKEDEEDLSILDDGLPEEGPVIESAITCKAESCFSREPPFSTEVRLHQYTTGNLEPSSGFDKVVLFEVPAEKEELHAPIDAWLDKEFTTTSEEAERVQEETSDSETEAVLEPTFESRTSSPASECEPEEIVFDQLAEFSGGENSLNANADAMSQPDVGFMVRTYEKEAEDKLYPDGEEMDTWDSVIERKDDPKKDDGVKRDGSETQHAEPEEDISTRDPAHEEKDIMEEVASFERHVDASMTSALTDTTLDDDGRQEKGLLDQEQVDYPNNDEENNEEEDDSQNVSVSWRTELESDSYAQDNTLADTRPLIRYKSDETDANTQASHLDESESSEGEEDKKVGDIETGTWNESKSKRFGTMEDLCEDGEGEVLDEEYDLGYTHIEDRDGGHVEVLGEHATVEINEESAEFETITKISEGPSDEETEELTELAEPKVASDVDYNEELESVDRLVEQELESLSTATYSAHFAQQQTAESETALNLQAKSVQEITEQQIGETRREDMFTCAEPEVTAHHKLISSTVIIDQPYEQPYFNDTSEERNHTDVLAQEVAQHEHEETRDAPEKREEEDEHNVSMVTHADLTEDQSASSDLNSKPESRANTKVSDMEESNSSEDESPNASQCSQLISTANVPADQDTLLDEVVPDELQEAVSVEVSSASLKHSVEKAADWQSFSEVLQTAEWEVLESPSKDLEARGRFADDQMCDDVPDTTQSFFDDEDTTHHTTHMIQNKSPEASPESIPAETDIFMVKESTESLKTNGKDRGLDSFFSSVNNDFWSSSLETGATYQPDDSYNKAAEQSNQNLGFGDNLVWGNLENPHVANGNSMMEFESSKALVAKKEVKQRPSEVKQLCRDVVEGDLVHSEDSEDEGQSWSSGEE